MWSIYLCHIINSYGYLPFTGPKPRQRAYLCAWRNLSKIPPPKCQTGAPANLYGAQQDGINSHQEAGLSHDAPDTQYASESLSAPPDGARVALIIESDVSRAPNLVPVMLHFSSVLGPAWSVILYTNEEHWEAPVSLAFTRAIQQHRIQIRFLPPQTQLTDSHSVSNFLTKSWIWEQVWTAQRVLMFQLDSVICSRSMATVEDFFQYDFVGAPIDAKDGEGFHGGLSLRNPVLFWTITEDADFQSSGVESEGQWFYAEAKKRVDQEGVVLPSQEVAQKFAVETIYYDKPLGYHQPQRWQKDRMDDIKKWCPEVGMLV